MRITFVVSGLDLTGGNRVISIYSRGLADRGHQVAIALRRSSGNGLLQRIKSWSGLGRRNSEEWPTTILDYGAVERILLPAHGRLKSEDFPEADAIIATWWETAETIAPLPVTCGKKAYLVQHHEVFDYLPRDRVERTYRQPMLQIVVARWLQDLMRQRYGSRTVVLIPNAVDFSQFFSEHHDKQAIPTVGFVYDHAKWKGSALIIEAIRRARLEIPSLRVIAFGHFDPTRELPLPSGTTYVKKPNQGELRHLYAGCDAWLFGSESEGFGLPMAEAMACGTPVIGTPAGAAPELLDGGCGILVPQADAGAMADAIVRICRLDNQQWRELSERATSRVRGHSWQNAIEQFEAAIGKLVAQ